MNKLKLVLGVLVIFMFGCQNLVNENSVDKDPVTVTTINPSEDTQAQFILREALTFGYNKSTISIDSLIAEIDHSEAVLVQQEKGGISRYTFTLNAKESLSYENLIVQVNEFGEYGAMIFRYEPDIDWLMNNNGVVYQNDFTGIIRLLTIDRKEFNQVVMSAGQGEYSPVENVQNKLFKTDCNSGSGDNSGGNSGSTGEGGPETGGNTGGSGNDGSSGGSSGEGSGSDSGNSDSEESTGGENTSGGSSCFWYMEGVTLVIDCTPIEIDWPDILDEDPNDIIVTKSITTCDGQIEAPTIGDGDVIGVGNHSIDLNNVFTLLDKLELKKHLLIDLSCEELEKWLELVNSELNEEVIQILNDLADSERLILNPYNQWNLQNITKAEGSTVNMDYFGVNLNLPNGVTPQEFLRTIRLNMNYFIDNSLANFVPYNSYNEALWSIDNYLGAIIHIDMGNNSPWLGGGFNPGIQPDDGSVIVSDIGDTYWRFSTIQAPGDFQHPVSGTREFGFISNSDGSYTFYTRGTDRSTGIIDNIIQENFNTIFNKADELWKSFQKGIADHINLNGGSATILEPEINRPDWDLLDSYIKGEISFNELQLGLGCED